MCDWASIEAAGNLAMLQAFGDPEPAVYQSVVNGVPTGDPKEITIVRHARVQEEAGAVSNVEEISVNPLDLPAPPQRGDWVTAWGQQFAVSSLRQPDPYGLYHLALIARPGA